MSSPMSTAAVAKAKMTGAAATLLGGVWLAQEIPSIDNLAPWFRAVVMLLAFSLFSATFFYLARIILKLPERMLTLDGAGREGQGRVGILERYRIVDAQALQYLTSKQDNMHEDVQKILNWMQTLEEEGVVVRKKRRSPSDRRESE